jgi:outer membrane receptor for ferrienterochelin and colicins
MQSHIQPQSYICRAPFVAFAMFAGGAVMSFADEKPRLLSMSLEELGELRIEVVDSASRFGQKVTEAPASVSVVTRDEIRKLGYRTIGDVLNGMRGLDIYQDHSSPRIGIRGYNDPDDYGNRMLLLVDGHRINDPAYDSAPVGYDSLVDLGLVERVELVRGPAASVYGANPLFGVVNIVTRRGGSIRGVETSVEYGSFDAWGGRLTYGNEWQGLELLLSGSYRASHGMEHYHLPSLAGAADGDSDGIAIDGDSEEAYNLFGSVNYEGWFLRGAYTARRKDDPTGAFGAIFDRMNYAHHERSFVEGGFSGSVGDAWKIDARLYHDTFRYSAGLYHRLPRFVLDKDFSKRAIPGLRDGLPFPKPPFAFLPPGAGGPSAGGFGPPPPGFLKQFEEVDVLTMGGASARTWGADLAVEKNLGDRVRMTFGADYRHVDRATLHNRDQGNFERLNLEVADSYDALGAMIASRVTIAKSAWLDASTRIDHSQVYGEKWSHRVGAVWMPDESTSLKLVWGTAFRPPNLVQRAFTIPGFTGNPDLNSEQIESKELIVEHYFSPRWRGQVSAYHTTVGDSIRVIDLDEHEHTFANGADLRMRGIDVELEGKFGSGWMVRTSYGYQETQDQGNRGRFENAPLHVAKAQVVAPIVPDKLFLGIEGIYASRRGTLGLSETNETWLLNANLFGKDIAPGLSISASVYNLLDRNNELPGAEQHAADILTSRGREFRLKLDYSF